MQELFELIIEKLKLLLSYIASYLPEIIINPSKKEHGEENKDNEQNSAPNSSETFFDTIKSFTVTLIIVIAIVAPIRMFIGKPFIVSGKSMDPSFDSWNYLLVDVFTYQFLHPPRRGDVIIFKSPISRHQYFIKRVIALPGESIEIKNGKVIIYNDEFPEGFELKEPYVAQANFKETDNIPKLTLGKDEYFVMGDNRVGSYDSRFWGPLKKDNIVGRAFLRLFPFTEIELLPAQN